MIKGFKDFIMRGNVIDLAVAVVVGAAFTALVTAVVDSIITPLISLFWQADENGNLGPEVEGLYGPVIFPIGNLINAIISFFAVALVVYFAFVMPMNTWKERQARKLGVDDNEEAKLPTEQELLVQIRDLLQRNDQEVAAAPAADAAPATRRSAPPTA